MLPIIHLEYSHRNSILLFHPLHNQLPPATGLPLHQSSSGMSARTHTLTHGRACEADSQALRQAGTFYRSVPENQVLDGII